MTYSEFIDLVENSPNTVTFDQITNDLKEIMGEIDSINPGYNLRILIFAYEKLCIAKMKQRDLQNTKTHITNQYINDHDTYGTA